MKCGARPFVAVLLLASLFVSLLSACESRSYAIAEPTGTPSSTATQAQTATATGTAAASATLSSQPIQDRTPISRATPEPLPEETRPGFFRPPSGWTIFSNPDYVQGIAVHDGILWAATLGGVASWDLESSKPTLYTTNDGLAEIQGNDIVFCPVPDDRMIVAHPSGTLSVYDLGLKKWSRMPITFADGSTLRGVTTLFCDADNRRLIVGSPDGLGIYSERTGYWKHIGPKEGLKTDTIRAIDVVGQTIWVAAGEKSAFFIMGNTIFPFNGASGFPSGAVYDLSVAPDASLWIGYSTGLVHYHDKLWNSYGAQTPSGIPFLSVDQVEVAPDKRTVWIGSAEEGVCPFNTVTLFCSTIYSGVPGAPITDLVVDENGTAYAGTGGKGIMVLDVDQVRTLAFDRQQLVSNNVYDISESSDGRLWVATDKGVNIFDPRKSKEPWQVMSARGNQLAYQQVRGMLPVADGMWFYYDQESQVSFTDGENWIQLGTLKGLSGSVYDAAVDQRGYVWFATSEGIQVWDGAIIRSYIPPGNLAINSYRVLFQQKGIMWVGTDRGLLSYDHFQWQMILPEISIRAIAPDIGGGLLLGTDQGLIRLDGSQSFLWIFNLGDEVVLNPIVTSIAWDGGGNLWVGTDGDGLLQFDGESWEQFNTVSGLPTDHVRAIHTDQLGEVWIATTTGEQGGALVRYMP